MDFKKQWNKIASVAVWIMGIIGAFVSAPPVGQEEGLGYFARFVVTVLVGVLLV